MITNTQPKILSRVQKLLKLSRSDNEHEAGAAAAAAAKLIEEYQLSEAMLRVDDEDAAPPEKIIEEYPLEGESSDPRWKKRHKLVTWKGNIAWGVSRACGCRYWWSNGQLRAFGRESAVQAWSYMCRYLINEVDRLADEGWERQRQRGAVDASARAWKNAFRVGASIVISGRLEDAAREAAERRKVAKQHVEEAEATAAREPLATPADDFDPDEVDDETTDEDRDADDAEIAAETVEPVKPKTEDLALVLIDKDREEVEKAYDDFGKRKKWRKPRTNYVRVSSTSGYEAGKQAGENVNLNRSRGRLPRGQARIGQED